MAMEYKWNCTRVRYYPEYEGQQDVVYRVIYNFLGIDVPSDPTQPAPGLAIEDTVNLTLDNIGTNFVPYADLTNDIVTGWVKNALGAEKIAEMEKSIVDRLAVSKTVKNGTIPM